MKRTTSIVDGLVGQGPEIAVETWTASLLAISFCLICVYCLLISHLAWKALFRNSWSGWVGFILTRSPD